MLRAARLQTWHRRSTPCNPKAANRNAYAHVQYCFAQAVTVHRLELMLQTLPSRMSSFMLLMWAGHAFSSRPMEHASVAMLSTCKASGC